MNRNHVSAILLTALALLAFAPAPAAGAGAEEIKIAGEGEIIGSIVSIVGATKTCECCGAGRCATCTTESDGRCQCDYDWQGYPRCSA